MISSHQWLFLVPLKGGRWHNPPIGSIYHLYIAFWGLYATYHLLGEPETTIDHMLHWPKKTVGPGCAGSFRRGVSHTAYPCEVSHPPRPCVSWWARYVPPTRNHHCKAPKGWFRLNDFHFQGGSYMESYCWWKTSHSQPPGMVLKPVVNNGIFTISTGYRRISEPSTVWDIFRSSETPRVSHAISASDFTLKVSWFGDSNLPTLQLSNVPPNH